jgi:hypothetical protein
MRPEAGKFKGRKGSGRAMGGACRSARRDAQCGCLRGGHVAAPAARPFTGGRQGKSVRLRAARMRSARRVFIHDPHRVAAGFLVRAQGEQAALLAVGQ